MSSDAAVVDVPAARRRNRGTGARPRRRATLAASLLARGEPTIWLTGGALAMALVMIAGLLALILVEGIRTFWPAPVMAVTTGTGDRFMGEVVRRESYAPGEHVFEQLPEPLAAKARQSLGPDGTAQRRLIRTGNVELTGTHFDWVDDFLVIDESRPSWAMVVERLARGDAAGRFYGLLVAFERDGKPVSADPAEAWRQFGRQHGEVRARSDQRRDLENHALGAIGRREEQARLAVVQAKLDHGAGSTELADARRDYQRVQRAAAGENARVSKQIADLNAENDRFQLLLQTIDGEPVRIRLADIVRAYPANQLTWSRKLGVYASRWVEFLTEEPREANSEGGVFPAIFGTVAMTLLMSLVVAPFGVLAALYLREYARSGPITSAVRIAINNLAGVPSIVFGVFGLGFFCYLLGGQVDQHLFAARLPNPTFGTGGLLWASLTLALLTLPVVIVATEEALAAVPNSMREGSYACGAGKWQTIRRIVLPRALPGIMTGMILAMARGAGEVAPLMLVGAVKLAPRLVVDGVFPFVHPERSFMHLGFHIYDVGFQSQNSEGAKPMVFTTTLLLICLVAVLNVAAVWLRARLRRRFVSDQF